jgi:hypothetical protein
LFTEDSKKEIDSLRENLTLAEEERDNSGASSKKELAKQSKTFEE